MIMRRELFIDDTPGYIRCAVAEDGVLAEILSEKQSGDDQTECLFYGKVQSIQKSINAAFVDIGTDLNAFLPLEDGMTLRCGQMMIVQGAAKHATPSKGLRITTKINLAGKWLVLIPGGSGVHISKKIKDPDLRDELLAVGKEICPDGFGLIVRTASSDISADLMADEVSQLVMKWQAIEQKAAGMIKPGLLHQHLRLDMRLVRDMSDISRITTNSKAGFEALQAEKESSRINGDTEIQLYEEKSQLIFDAFGIEHQIDRALRKRVWLPCGGYLVIDFCEAMTVIDVNSGKMTLGRSIEDTALKVNLEAAEEAARQIRLRDIGGIIIVDFIDMRDEAHRQELIARMKQVVKSDRSRVIVEGITRLGLMEISRKRVHRDLRKAMTVSCSYCSGSAEVLSGEEVAARALRQARRMKISGQRGPFLIRCAQAAAQALESANLHAMEDSAVYVLAVSGKHAEKFEIEQLGDGMPLPKGAAKLKTED